MAIPRLNKETSLFSHTHSIEAGIRVLTDSVESFVDMSDTYTDLNGDTVANKAASRIKQNADNIQLRVEKNGVISSINQSPEAVTIDASRVDIAGAAMFRSGGSLSKVVKTMSMQWYSSTSSTSRTGGSWSTNQPSVTAGRYIWERTYYTYSDGTTEYRPSEGGVCVTAPTDISATVRSVDVEYADSTSSSTPPSSTSGTWSTNPPSWQAGHYIWQRTKTVTPAGTSYSQAVCISGRDGDSAYSYSVNASPSAMVRAENGSLTPSSITFSATRTHGTGNPESYAGRFIIAEHDGSGWVNRYASSGNESSKSYTPTSTARVVRCELYLAGGTTTLLDTQTAPIVGDGADGTSVSVSKIEYGTSDSASSEPSYSKTVPTSIAKGKWLWVRTTYSSGSASVSKSYVGTDGEDGTSVYVTSSTKSNGVTTVRLSDGTTMTIRDGADGENGTKGANGYVHTAWANSSDGSTGFSTTASANKKYLGVYTDNTAADSTNPSAYSWSLIKGDDGADGYTVMLTNENHTFAGSATAAIASTATSQVVAYKGATQISSTIGNITGAPTGMSVSINHNNSTTAMFNVSVTESLKTGSGTLVIPVTADGKSFSLHFSWSVAFAGEKGDDGRGIRLVEEEYYLSNSNTSRTGGSWVSAPPEWANGKYCWTRSKITWDDEQVTYTTPVLAMDITSVATLANKGVFRQQTIWKSASSGTNSMSGTNIWVTDASGSQNRWTAVRPVYDKFYPVMFVATQSQTVQQEGTTACQCTTPAKDETLTVIDGGHITTGTIDASTVTVTNINASNISTGTLSADRIGAKSISAAKLAASAVTAEKIASGAITADKISSSAVTTDKLSANAVTAAKIASGAVTADKIKAGSLTVGLLDGEIWRGISWYAESGNAGSTAAKTATIVTSVSDFTLRNGMGVKVKFAYTNTASTTSISLNVNSTGAKYIRYTSPSGGIDVIPTKGLIQSGRVYEFIYDGTYWVMQFSTDTFSRTRYDSVIRATSSITGGRIICGTSNGYRNVAANVQFDMSYPLLYADKDISSGSLGSDNYSKIDNISYLNNTTVTGGAANKVVYLKGKLSANTFTIASSGWLTTNVPSSEDGYAYIPLGIMSTSSVGYFDPSESIWEYVDGAFGPAAFRESSLASKTATNYLTNVAGGIKIHPMGGSNLNYAVLDSTGLELFKGGGSISKFGETVRLGAPNGVRMEQTSNSMDFYDMSGFKYLSMGDLRSYVDEEPTISEKFVGNGSRTIFRLANHRKSLKSVKVDGVAAGYHLVPDDGGDITFDSPPPLGSVVSITYVTTEQAIDTSYYSFGIRLRNEDCVNGPMSVALGSLNEAAGAYTLAAGDVNSAFGHASAAIGASNTTSGDYSFAAGLGNHAAGDGTAALGIGLTDLSDPYPHRSKFLCGEYNQFVDEDIFEIGNGAWDGARSNAFRVRENGEVYSGSTLVTSDGRVKSDIESIDVDDALDLVMGLSPKSYRKFGRLELGFVAQDVEGLTFGDALVDESPNFGYDDFRSLSYEGLIAPVVSVEQSLVTQLGDANKRIGILEAENAELRSRLSTLEDEVSALLRTKIGDDSR